MPPTAPLPRTLAVLRKGLEAGLHIGAQGTILQHGKTVSEFALGESRPGVAMSDDTLMLWFSACKPVGGVAIAQLLERRLVDLDDPVAHIIPEFGVKGKE